MLLCPIVRLWFRGITLCRSRLIDQPANAAFPGAMHLPHLRNRRSLGLRAYHFFSNQILQHCDVERLIGHYPLQLRVLFFQLLQPFWNRSRPPYSLRQA
jgi:hypothetical protein